MRGVCAPATPRKEKLGRKSSATMSTTGRGRRNSARAATAATTIDATRALRAAKDSASARGLTRADETRDGEIDVDARVRQGARRHGASLREANALRGRD